MPPAQRPLCQEVSVVNDIAEPVVRRTTSEAILGGAGHEVWALRYALMTIRSLHA